MSYIYSGNDKYITRDGNLRHDFVACNLREKIKFILRSYGFSPLDYTKFFDKYYDELIEKEDSKTL